MQLFGKNFKELLQNIQHAAIIINYIETVRLMIMKNGFIMDI